MLQFSLGVGVGVVMCLRAVADRAGEANKSLSIKLGFTGGLSVRTSKISVSTVPFQSS